MNRKFANTKLPDEGAMVLTIPQVARYLMISPLRAYALAAEGKIPCVHFGRSVRVVRADLEKMLAGATERAGREGGVR
jgi:excisionase family DNA binding protein